MIAIVISVRWHLNCSLICISLMINDTEDLFMCFLTVCISFLEKHLFRSFVHFLIGLIFWHRAAWDVYIFWKLNSCCRYFFIWKYFPLFWGCLFVLVMAFFAVQKPLILIRFHLYFLFAFIFITLWGGITMICIRVFCLFYSKNFIVGGLTFSSLIHFEFIFVYGVGECSNFILLHVTIWISWIVEEAVLSPLSILAIGDLIGNLIGIVLNL